MTGRDCFTKCNNLLEYLKCRTGLSGFILSFGSSGAIVSSLISLGDPVTASRFFLFVEPFLLGLALAFYFVTRDCGGGG